MTTYYWQLSTDYWLLTTSYWLLLTAEDVEKGVWAELGRYKELFPVRTCGLDRGLSVDLQMTLIVSHLDGSGLCTMSGSDCEIFVTIINKLKLHFVINTYKSHHLARTRSLCQHTRYGKLEAVSIIFYWSAGFLLSMKSTLKIYITTFYPYIAW